MVTGIEIAFGAVPSKVETNALEPRTVLHLSYAHEEPGYKIST